VIIGLGAARTREPPERLAELKAGSREPLPAEVFGVIETALRSHFAKEIPA